MRLTLNRPIGLAQFKEIHWGHWKLTEISTRFRRKLLVKRVKLQALEKSTINKQWALFKDPETFRLFRVRTRDSRTSSHMAKSLFYFAYLKSEQMIPVVWNGSEKISQHLGEKNCLLFKQLDCFIVNFCSCEP